MPFREYTIYFVANNQLKEELTKDPVLSYNLHWIKPETLKDATLPEDGLFAVRNIQNPEYIDDPYSIPWDAIWSKTRYKLTFPASEVPSFKQPPDRMLERIYELVSTCNSKAFYYLVEMHGGDVIHEYTWIFGQNQVMILDDEHQVSLTTRKAYINGEKVVLLGDVLYLALKEIGVKTEGTSGWFEPHTGTFIWRTTRLSPKINKEPKLPAFPTSLFRSAALGDFESVQKCIEAGISPLHYNNLLEVSSRSGNAQLVQSLLDQKVELKSKWNGPLNAAQNKETIEILLKHGAAINHESNPLAHIAQSGNEAAVRYMIERGAKLTLGERNELWFGACQGGILFLVQALFPKVDPEAEYICDTGVTLAAANNRLNVVTWLIGQGVKLYPDTLIAAAEQGHLQTVEWLLQNTALNINAINKMGHSVLYEATQNGKIEMVNYLLDQGADQHQRLGNYEFSPIHIACFASSIPLVKRFLEAGISINCTAKDGRTPLYIAIDHQNQEMVNFLMKQGANIDQAGGYGDKNLQEMADRKQILITKPQ
ncbi:MAG TPA: hypothetical protein DCS93_19185 [Microscillaceae bacterium]|nr:hypothetical protein [Microscillaceae bacterium]